MDKQKRNDEIRKAIGAHGAWKLRLRTAARTKQRNLPVEEISRDDACDFGRWLKSVENSPQEAQYLETAKALHADFHSEAGKVARLIRDGREDAALAALEDDSDFIKVSKTLTKALSRWQLGM